MKTKAKKVRTLMVGKFLKSNYKTLTITPREAVWPRSAGPHSIYGITSGILPGKDGEYLFDAPFDVHANGVKLRTGKWSGKVMFHKKINRVAKTPLPEIGGRVLVTINGFGEGTVVAYFFESDYIGVEVAVDKRPDWHIEQNGDKDRNPLVFGSEVEVL